MTQADKPATVGKEGSDDTPPPLLLMIGPPGQTALEPLQPATIGLEYLETLSASGGTPPYDFSVFSGVPPNGIALHPTRFPDRAMLSGTPTEAGSFTFAVGVSDSTTPTQLTATKTLTFEVIPSQNKS
jgi:hypothetical protein